MLYTFRFSQYPWSSQSLLQVTSSSSNAPFSLHVLFFTKCFLNYKTQQHSNEHSLELNTASIEYTSVSFYNHESMETKKPVSSNLFFWSSKPSVGPGFTSKVNKRKKMTRVLFSAPTQKETLVRDCGLQQYLAADNTHKMCIKTYVTDLHENFATPNCLLLLCCITKINPTALVWFYNKITWSGKVLPVSWIHTSNVVFSIYPPTHRNCRHWNLFKILRPLIHTVHIIFKVRI